VVWIGRKILQGLSWTKKANDGLENQLLSKLYGSSVD
jgi:hypothetical protein